MENEVLIKFDNTTQTKTFLDWFAIRGQLNYSTYIRDLKEPKVRFIATLCEQNEIKFIYMDSYE
jgi:hypothetical protein